jgi:hypothetical protein
MVKNYIKKYTNPLVVREIKSTKWYHHTLQHWKKWNIRQQYVLVRMNSSKNFHTLLVGTTFSKTILGKPSGIILGSILLSGPHVN